jgi:hypothetical protein
MIKVLVCGALLVSLTGCATRLAPVEAETLTISRGACFGFCPVYRISATSSGIVEFTGVRHTAYLGNKQVQIGRDVVARLLAQLAPFRPTAATLPFQCEATVSDQSDYEVTWTAGTKPQPNSLTFNSGCHSVEGLKLRSILESAPAVLGVGDEAKQLTRPGASRG